VNVRAATWENIAPYCQGESMGLVKLKGKGEMEIFRIDGLKPSS
jgi:hypothetical protein